MTSLLQSVSQLMTPVLEKPVLGKSLPEILMITSYPPRECGIATYSSDLKKALQNKFKQSFSISICALETKTNSHLYDEPIAYTLNTDEPNAFLKLAHKINSNHAISMIMVQHEFGFYHHCSEAFQELIDNVSKPVIVAFHTILPLPDEILRVKVQRICRAAEKIVVMTMSSANILAKDYGIPLQKVTVIPHGTHLVSHRSKADLKEQYQLTGKKILSTFGLLSSGKNIETTLAALPAIIAQHPDVQFLIIGKTHPSVVLHEGEQYRKLLQEKIKELQLESYVTFINSFLPTPELLEYLQMTDIYLFTSCDRNQAVSGTFSYAISCGCPVISTPIPHALEVLQNENGIIIDFENPAQLSKAVNTLLNDDVRRTNISLNSLHRMAPTAWENAAISHAQLFASISNGNIDLKYTMPDVNLDHIKKMTTDMGIIQFSKINQPDIESGYTLDDNARALVAMCQHYEQFANESDLANIETYFNFIEYCQQPNGNFLNYVHEDGSFTPQNNSTNLADSNGRAFWALGYLISMHRTLSPMIISRATVVINKALPLMLHNHSSRAMAFAIKGLYYKSLHQTSKDSKDAAMITTLANRLVQMYRHEAGKNWKWFESYLTYANSILPEAMLCAYLTTKNPAYKFIAIESFDFLLSKTFVENDIHVISNKNWLQKDTIPLNAVRGGEQPIDVAYTVMALSKFYQAFQNEAYLLKMHQAFNWFLGQNHLHQIMYNPCTGGCYDGLEEDYINLNQGAESTISYLMARLTISAEQAKTTCKQFLLPAARTTQLMTAFAAPVNHTTFDELRVTVNLIQ